MKYTRHGENITLEMTVDDYERLLVMMGFALAGAMEKDRIDGTKMAYRWLRFLNDLNNGNPNFTPYEIPKEAS